MFTGMFIRAVLAINQYIASITVTVSGCAERQNKMSSQLTRSIKMQFKVHFKNLKVCMIGAVSVVYSFVLSLETTVK